MISDDTKHPGAGMYYDNISWLFAIHVRLLMLFDLGDEPIQPFSDFFWGPGIYLAASAPIIRNPSLTRLPHSRHAKCYTVTLYHAPVSFFAL